MARSISAQSFDNTRRIDQGQAPRPIRDPNLATGAGYSGGAYVGVPTTTPAPGVGGVGSRPAAPPPGTGGGAAAPPPWTPYSAPGVGETWWDQHTDQWNQPTDSSQYWNGVKGYFTTNPTSNETNIQKYGSELGGAPGSMEKLYDEYSGAGEFTKPGSAEDWWTQNGGQFSNPGDMEKFYGANVDKLYNNNNLGDHAGGIAGDINSARNTGAFYGATAGDLARPGYAESLADQFNPGAKTYNEQFLLGGGATDGLDSLYSRLTAQGSRRLDDAAAARGGFNSGASLRAQEELGADMNAQHVRDYMSASQAADASAGDYRNYGLGLMTSADNGLRGRIDLGLKGANLTDTTALSRAKAGQDLYTGVSDELRNNLKTAGDWAHNSQSDGLQRLLGGSESSKRAQDANDQRLRTGIAGATSAEDELRGRLKDASGMESDSQKLAIDRILAGNTISSTADNSDTTRWTTAQNAANSAQNDKLNRENSVIDNLLKVAGPQAGATSSAMDTIRKEEGQRFADQINGMLRSGQITAEQIQAKYGAQMQALGLIMQGGELVASGGLSGGVPSGSGQPQTPPSPSYYGRPAVGPGGAGNDTLPINF